MKPFLKNVKILLIFITTIVISAINLNATENLDRGVVAVRSSNNTVFVSWRFLETDPADIGFNVYRSSDGGEFIKLNSAVLSVLTGGTNFTDTTADVSKASSFEYLVKPVINGVEVSDLKSSVKGARMAPISGKYKLTATQAEPCFVVPIKSGVLIHFVWVGDLDGNGTLDYVVDRLDWTNGGCKIEAYKSDGTYLWTVDFGPNSKNMDNISPGSATIDVGHWDGVTVGDVNGDGKAEVIIKIANGVKFGDGTTWTNSDNNKQWIAVLNGTTGARLKYCAIPTDYLSVGPMGCQLGIGNTNNIFAFLKNRNADKSFNCMVCCFQMGSSLTLKWKWLRGSTNAPDGHQMRIVDVNGDGIDDFTHIGFALNGSNGTLLYSLGNSGVIHGDRYHIGKFDKNRSGLQGYGIQQSNPSGLLEYYYDAKNGSILWRHTGAVGDVGRGDAGDIDPNYGGYEVWSFQGLYNAKSNTKISSNAPYPVLRLWWDGDILSEQYNDGKIENWNYSTKSVERLVSTWNYYNAVGSDRGAPMFYGDIIGDWREEVILTSSDYSKLVIFTTNISTSISHTSPRNDRYYRNCLSVKGYMQSHHTSYYFGDETKSAEMDENVTSIENYSHHFKTFIIYPNPLDNDILNLRISISKPTNINVYITDVTGKEVFNQNLGYNEVGLLDQKLNLINLSKGLYMLKIYTIEGIQSEKFIKL
jgi:hypothetical protein